LLLRIAGAKSKSYPQLAKELLNEEPKAAKDSPGEKQIARLSTRDESTN
jgi:hypothetical protein